MSASIPRLRGGAHLRPTGGPRGGKREKRINDESLRHVSKKATLRSRRNPPWPVRASENKL